MRLAALTSATLTLAVTAHCACECGYVLHDTSAYYTHVLTHNFSTYPDGTSLNTNQALADFSKDWTVQSWSAGAGPDNPIPRNNAEANVFVQDGTLVLRQVGYTAADESANRSVSIAAIVSEEASFLHGSFRSVFKVSEDRGSVGGFFWYHNDTNEIDIEVLTKEPNDTTIHYTTHPSLLSSSDAIIPGASTAANLATPWTAFQEHRFDWSRQNITFYQSGVPSHTTTVNVPHVDGSVQMNLWADGSAWSGRPSATNVTMSVKSITLFYNTTASEAGTDQAFNKACQDAGGRNNFAVCMDTDPRVMGVKSAAALRAGGGKEWVGFLVACVLAALLV